MTFNICFFHGGTAALIYCIFSPCFIEILTLTIHLNLFAKGKFRIETFSYQNSYFNLFS